MPTPLTDAINALTTYANETTGASDATLSEAVATLVDGYGGGGGTNVLTHSWDFTQSTVDTIGGMPATLTNCTQSSSGVYFDQSSSRITFLTKVLKTNSRYEIDIASYNRQGTNHGRLAMVSSDQGFAYRSTGYWGAYRNGGGTQMGWQMSNISDPAYFDGHTFKMAIDENGITSFYRDNDLIMSVNGLMYDGTLTIGYSSNSAYNLTITGLRIYENASSGSGGWTTEGIARGIEPIGAITINAENVSTIRRNAFYQCKGITELTLVGTPYFGYEAFRECTNLETINAKDLTYIKGGNYSSQTNVFYGCTSLKGIVLPSLDGSTYNIDSNNFRGCSSLKYADINNLSKLADRVFSGCTVFDTLIIRKTNSVPTLQTLLVFENTPFASGGTGGTLYVPNDLISTYQSASNWSTILGYTNNSIQAIEGSQYENYYADGTPIE